ncbi:TonB-dependent receptor [Qipengyuania sp. 6B39]|uniref:TonB-dependent receptor n=1 Tax=Qipengyuania proteolytica TaxID=2867239 RepID=UPI001C89EDF2|nr:TonB-dependent receptor [Qipengyuania proteolytica]MBX7494318.1 TonB-dependent receptor [Qipengyuania proteolytica]
MIARHSLFYSASLAALIPHPAWAQQTDTPAETQTGESQNLEQTDAASADDPFIDDGSGNVIVVTASGERKLRGAVDGDIEPEVQLDRAQIRALGVSNLAEVLEELAPQIGSAQGRGGERPVVLVNGRRISSFREIRGYPPEAVVRIDILPEEVALTYGYSANQKVVNFVLRPRFNAITAEIRAGTTTDGGGGTQRASVNYLAVRQENRLSVDLEYKRDGGLLEADRDILARDRGAAFGTPGNVVAVSGGEIDPALSALAGETVTIAALPAEVGSLRDFVAGANDPAPSDDTEFRSLRGSSDTADLSVSLARPVAGTTTFSGTIGISAQEGTSLLGLPEVAVIVPATNPNSPFVQDVRVLRQIDDAPALQRETSSRNFELATNFLGDLGGWRWSAGLGYDHGERETLTDRDPALDAYQQKILTGDPALNPFTQIPSSALVSAGRDRSYSNTEDVSAQATFGGTVLQLPAGSATASLRTNARYQHIDSQYYRQNTVGAAVLDRATLGAQASLDVPVLEYRGPGPDWLGDLSLNLNSEVSELSDAGTLLTLGGGLNWEPIPEIRVIASFSREEGAPSIQQLGDPLIETPNVATIDFVTSDTVEITRLSGGNTGLGTDTRRVFKLGTTVRPFEEFDLSLNANYTDTRIDNPIASFPTATAEIERAFPDRFIRDAGGRLISVDARPINFASSEERQLRWGINLSVPIGSENVARGGGRGGNSGGGGGRGGGAGRGTAPSDSADAQPDSSGTQSTVGEAAGALGNSDASESGKTQQDSNQSSRRRGGGQSAARGGGSGGRGGGSGRGGGGAGRLSFSVYHTWALENRIEIGPEIPALDMLDGSATGGRGGAPRHEVEAQLGFSLAGFGARATGTWRSATNVLVDRLDQAGSPDDLFYEPEMQVDLRLYVDFNQQRSLVEEVPFLRGSRLTLNVDNVFNDRPDVFDGAGITPLAYQPSLLEPAGRTVSISFRKLFF